MAAILDSASLVPRSSCDFTKGRAKEGTPDPGLDYFASSPSENTKRLTKTFGAESVVITGSRPKND
ncbi:MAG: hypothetical protein AUF79_06760 [Crenarchaeota archaeon 13_1_20CM_2_51_8]|nr:MAG: hypothetical protein AUF79_06760 [Crenarchaeota archaeon 13_1_20CM_2_51_8]